MRPSALDELGLGDALTGLVGEWETLTMLAIELELSAEQPDGEAAEVLFRVAQEALTNVMRHAQASLVRLTVGRIQDSWVLRVQDDGVGLSDPAPVGLGLLGLPVSAAAPASTPEARRVSPARRRVAVNSLP